MNSIGLIQTPPSREAPKRKYVIVDIEGIPSVFTFQAHIGHSNGLPEMFHHKVVSAGFFEVSIRMDEGSTHMFPELEITVWGESNTLGVSSRPEDRFILEAFLAEAVMTLNAQMEGAEKILGK